MKLVNGWDVVENAEDCEQWATEHCTWGQDYPDTYPAIVVEDIDGSESVYAQYFTAATIKGMAEAIQTQPASTGDSANADSTNAS